MPNVYEAKLSDGTAYNVTTNHHHDDHDDRAFKHHLLEVIKAAAGQVISGVVVGYVFKGKK